ncbi:hypothetical protein ACHHYP_12601 [Achlya hypogyna]|uniref:Tyrosine-protein kinase catalytic domain-containing protein n=1 Tax=Achlya hypogyna TaxID=1202772 RepID=A0A1V9YGM1_ACHHY|nr:hypothetical protein ACHHYP_12601 [Achlya hypogyna]
MGVCMSKESSAGFVMEPQRPQATHRKPAPALANEKAPLTPPPQPLPKQDAVPRSASDASTVTDSMDVKFVVVDTALFGSPVSPVAASPKSAGSSNVAATEVSPPSPPVVPAEPSSPAETPVDETLASPSFQPHSCKPVVTLSKSLSKSSSAMFFPLYGVLSKPRKSYVPMLEVKRHNSALPVNVDAVQFGAFGPPSIGNGARFGLSIWAFLMAFDATSGSTTDAWMALERGQMVHVTLTAPEGSFTVEDGETKAFVWDHHVTHVHYDIAVIDGNMSRPFFAEIVAGVHVLRLTFQLATLSDGAALTQEYPSHASLVHEELRVLSAHDVDVPAGGTVGSLKGRAVNIDAMADGALVDVLGARLQQMSHHPRVASVLGAANLLGQWHWVSAHQEDTFTLHTYLGQRLSTDEKMGLLKDIAAALAHMHHCAIAHNSVSTRHCTVDLDGHATLGGFVAVAAADSTTDMAMDVLEFGLLLWEIFTDVPATEIGSTWAEIVAAVQLGPHAAAIPVACQSLLLSCLSDDPTLRPSMVDLVDALTSSKHKPLFDVANQLKHVQ